MKDINLYPAKYLLCDAFISIDEEDDHVTTIVTDIKVPSGTDVIWAIHEHLLVKYPLLIGRDYTLSLQKLSIKAFGVDISYPEPLSTCCKIYVSIYDEICLRNDYLINKSPRVAVEIGFSISPAFVFLSSEYLCL